MNNLLKYNRLSDYTNRTGDSNEDECRVSQIGPSENLSIIYDIPTSGAKNTILEHWQLSKNDVAAVVKDLSDGRIKYILWNQLDLRSLDESYEIKNWIRYRGEGLTQFLLYSENIGRGDILRFASGNYYSLVPNMTMSSVVSMVITGLTTATDEVVFSLNWPAGANIQTVANSFNIISYTGTNPTVSTYSANINNDQYNIVIYPNTVNNTINMQLNGYGCNLGFHGQTSASITITDLSKILLFKNDDGDITIPAGYVQNHNSWQSDPFKNIPADLILRINAAYGTEDIYNQHAYCVHGEDLRGYSGLNRNRCSEYYSVNGTQILLDPFVGFPISESFFNSWSQSEFSTYDDYITARMFDTESTEGTNSVAKNRLFEVTDILSRFYTRDLDGNNVPVFNPAHLCKGITDPDLCPNGASMMNSHHLALILSDCIGSTASEANTGTVYKINSVIHTLGGDTMDAESVYPTTSFYSTGSIYMSDSTGILSNKQMKTSTNVRLVPVTAYRAA